MLFLISQNPIILKKSLLFLVFIFSTKVISQNNFHLSNAYNLNVIKVNVLGVPSNMISLKYERLLLDKTTTFNLGVNYMFKSKVPHLNIFDNFIESKKTLQTLSNTKVSNFSIIPEVRFYLTDVDASGIYLAPFLRFDHYKATVDFHYQYYDTTQSILLNGSLNAFGIGFSAGKQWKLGNNWYIDWNVINLTYHANSGKFSNQTKLTSDEQHYIKYGLDNFIFKNGKTNSEVNENGASYSIKMKNFIPRMALSFGRRF